LAGGEEMKNKVLVSVVILSFLICSANIIANERRGAELVITRTDGQQIKGELIAVKPSSLLLLDSQTGADVSVEMGEIAVIKIVKKSKALTGAIGGFLIGGGAGYLVAYATDKEYATDPETHVFLYYGILGLIAGWIAGEAWGRDKTSKIKGKSPEEIKAVLENLRSQARIINFQ
jgi:hypothetical protein